MSRTEIYKIGGEEPCEIGEVRNAFRGAMFIWNEVAKKYFGMDFFPFLDKTEQMKVWNAWSTKDLPMWEKIVLLSTMDNVVISNDNKDKLVSAYEEYHKIYPNSSFGDQAKIIKEASIKDGEYIAFNQTSVSDFWGAVFDDEKEYYIWYDPNKGKDHFELFSELEEQNDR